MPIDTSGEWWTGSGFDDLAEYIRRYQEDGYPVDRVIQSVCGCGSTGFRLVADGDAGCVQRQCVACGESAFIGDSADYWEEAEPEQVRCPCGHEVYEVGIAFSFRQEGEIRWVTVGARCTRCGILGSPADWKIDYAPSTHLLRMI